MTASAHLEALGGGGVRLVNRMAAKATEAFVFDSTFRCFNLIRTRAVGIVTIVRLHNPPS